MKNKVFIGRESELQKLEAALNQVKSSKGKLVLIEGSAGSGKSGLVQHFFKQKCKNDEILTAISECNDKENLNAYAPFKEILIQLNTKSEKKDNTSKFKNFITEAGSSWIELIPIIGSYAKVGVETYEAYKKTYDKKVTSKVESENDVYRIFENEFKRLATNKTVVIFLDDLQWADASSLNLLFALGKLVRSTPIKLLILGSFRPNEIKVGRTKISESGSLITVRHPFEDKLNELRNYCKQESHIENNNWFQEIILKPFTNTEIEELINFKFPKNNFNSQFVAKIQNLTDGHPLYLTEILNYLERNDIIYQNNELYNVKPFELTDLPVSLNGVISEKVERLNDDLKMVLSCASVNGEEFSAKIIEKILNIDELNLFTYLEELSQKHSLLTEGEPIRIKNMLFELYSFSQTLVHKYLYENMDNARRRLLHRRIAATIKELYGEELINNNKDIQGKYNYHNQIGLGLIPTNNVSDEMTSEEEVSTEKPMDNLFLEAAESEIENAQDSFDIFAISECYDFINKALAFLSKAKNSNPDKHILKFEALHLRSKALFWQGHYQKSLDVGKEIENIAKTNISDNLYVAKACVCIGKAKTLLGNCENALLFLYQANSIFEEKNNHELLWDSYKETAITKLKVAAFDEAIEYHKKALKLAEKLNDQNKIAESLLNIGNNYSFKSEYSTAINYYNQALDIFKTQNNKFLIGQVYNKKGLALRSNKYFDEAMVYFEKAFEIAKEQNDLVSMSHRYNNMALILEDKGNYDLAIEYLKKSLAIDEQLDDKLMVIKSNCNIGQTYITKGDKQQARKHLNTALELSEKINDKGVLAFTYSSVGHGYSSLNDIDNSIKYLNSSIAIYQELDDKSELANTYNGLGNTYLMNSEYDLAVEQYQKALDFYKQVNDRSSIVMIMNNLGVVYYGQDKYEEAIKYYQETLDYSTKVNDKLGRSKALGNIGNCYYYSNNYSKAIEIFKESIEYLDSVNESYLQSGYVKSLANSYYNLKKYERAIIYYEKAVELYSNLNQPEEVATNLEYCALSHYYNKNYEKAIEVFTKQLAYEIKLDKPKAIAECYFQIGLSHYWIDSYIEAIENLLKALDYAHKIYGETHEITEGYNYQLSLAYYWGSQYEKAIETQLKSLELRKQLYGLDSTEYDVVNYALAQSYYLADFDDLAKSTLEKTIQFRSKFFNEDSEEYKNAIELWSKFNKTNVATSEGQSAPSSRSEVASESTNNLAILIENGDTKYDENELEPALDYYLKALDLIDTKVESHENATIHFKLGMVYKNLENYKVARGCFYTSLQIFEKIYGKNNVETAKSYSYLGDSLYYLEQYDDAIHCHTEALNAYININGKNDVMVAWSHYDLGEDYYWAENYTNSIEHFKKCLEIRIELDGIEATSVAKAYYKIGLSYYWNEQYQLAVMNLTKAFDIYKKLLTINSDEADFTRFALAKAYYYADMDEIAKEYLFDTLHYRKEKFGDTSQEYDQIRKWIEKYIMS